MKIVIPVDGFNISWTVLQKGIEIAKKEKCPIKIAAFLRETDIARYIRDSRLFRAVDGSVISGREVNICNEAVMFKIERKICSYLKQTDIDEVEWEIEVSLGQPCDMVSQAAHDGEVNLIVMGQSGQSSIKRFFMGSVAPIYASERNMPILIVHEDCLNGEMK